MNKNILPARHQVVRNEVLAMTLDAVVAEHSAFQTFEALIQDSLRTGYRPSLYTKPMGKAKHHYRRAELALRIAEAFDYEMARRGSNTRCFYGNDEQPKRAPQYNPEPAAAFMTYESQGWERAWAELGKKVDARRQENNEGWQYMGSSCGSHQFRHRSYDGKRRVEYIPVESGDFEPAKSSKVVETLTRFERV